MLLGGMLNKGRKKKGLTLTQRGSQAKKRSITVAFRGVCVCERDRDREGETRLLMPTLTLHKVTGDVEVETAENMETED